tara:strand:+ start:4065 stop:4910 length:846 start_codon:yes stop_codon:yes gene_type:complete
MAVGKIDLFDAILNRQVSKSAEKIGKAGSDMAENQAFGGMIGGLLGQYGVPALLGLIPGVGPVLAAIASAAGAGLGAYAGSEIGRTGTDMPDTEYLQSKGQEVTDMLKEKSVTSGLTSAATAGASAMSMGVDKYAAHLKNPLGLKSMAEKIKADPTKGVSFTPTTMTPGYTPPAILNSPTRANVSGLNLRLPPSASIQGVTGSVTAPLPLNVQQQAKSIVSRPSLLNYVPNLGGLNLGNTGIRQQVNPLLTKPLISTRNLLNLPSTRVNPYPMYQPTTGPI